MVTLSADTNNVFDPWSCRGVLLGLHAHGHRHWPHSGQWTNGAVVFLLIALVLLVVLAFHFVLFSAYFGGGFVSRSAHYVPKPWILDLGVASCVVDAGT